MMMAGSSVQGEGRNNGGEQEWPPSLTAAFKRGWDSGFALGRAAFIPASRRRAEQANPLAYDEARAAYEQARATNAHARAYDRALTHAHVRAYVSLAVKASGLLALSLSTVILLGGYVQSLEKKDFFCIMVITVIQAAGIFQDWENNLKYLSDFGETFVVLLSKLNLMMNLSPKGILVAYISAPVVLPFLVLILCVQLFYLLGPLVCAAISSWRIAKLNHGNRDDGTDSTADMLATLNIFYSLIIFQGTMFLVLLLHMSAYEAISESRLLELEQLSSEKWGEKAIEKYLSDISEKCRKDPLSIKGRDLIKYASELLDSESHEDYLYGARLLSFFVNKGKGEDVRWLLLPSTHKIQRLVDSLWTSSRLDDNTEIRELAATILADLAGHIDVARYPGAMRYISSLLHEETTQIYCSSSKQAASDPQPPQLIGPFEILFQSKVEQLQNLTRLEEQRQWRLMRDQNRLGTSQERRRQKSQGGTSNKLVLQGLTILEGLASNSDNRRLICSTPGLLPKITGPLYSETLTEDVKTKAWADIVTRCLKVLYQLIRATGWTSRMLRHQISSHDQALSNLKSIILLEVGNDEAGLKELKLRAMEIVTELALDLSINLTDDIKEVLIRKQLQLFLLANGDGAAAVTAGRTLVSLSTNRVRNSALIMTTQNDIIGCLTVIIDDENITRRTIAAEIMANLCAHCNVDNNMKEILLPKVLRKILSVKTKSQETNISAGQNIPASGDVENQWNSVSINNEERQHNVPTEGDDTQREEISDQEREEQEAFLSLAQVICARLDSAHLDGAIQNAVQNENNNEGSEEQRREAFVDKLKTIIDGNCHPAADSLRIVKLCCQIAKSVMRCEQYIEIFRNKGFKSSLTEASETMSKLESCMLFVGTDFGLKKTVRPLFSEIVSEM